MDHNSTLTLYLAAITLITYLFAGFGVYLGRQVRNANWRNLILAFFFISSAIWCFDGYERANLLIREYLENKSISEELFNELLKTIVLLKLVFPATLAAIGISQANDLIKRFTKANKS